MYNSILVAVDGAEAAKLTKEQHATIRLLHVSEELPLHMVAEMPFPLTDYKKLVRNGGEALLAKCAAERSVSSKPSMPLNGSLMEGRARHGDTAPITDAIRSRPRVTHTKL